MVLSQRPMSNWKAVARGWAVRFVACAIAWTGSASALQLDETPTELRGTLSQDYLHARGATLLAARYGGAWGVRLGTWLSTNDLDPKPHLGTAADYVWPLGKWRAGLGAPRVDETTNINGTHWLHDVSLAYDLTRRHPCRYRHLCDR